MFAKALDTCLEDVIAPSQEITSYEALWTRYNTYPQIANLFRKFNHALPSRIVREEGISSDEVEQVKLVTQQLLPFTKYSALFYQDFEYPGRLRDAKHPVEVLYYRGNLDLLSSRAVAVVGARKATEEGLRRARKVARLLVENDFTVMSGLAEGIDTAAHEEAILLGGRTIGVLGTPLNQVYPQKNKPLQESIGRNHLIVSQVPFYKYSLQNYRTNRFFFPERNKTMSALSLATIIIEASDSSGTLTQAEAALEQKRKLFILKSCFERGLSWPDKFLAKGAIKIEDGTEILEHLGKVNYAESGIEMAQD
jgi:DNA processing protein